MLEPILNSFEILDLLAFAFFLIAWIGFTIVADYSSFHSRTVTAKINLVRKLWMQQMLQRDFRMVDTQIMGNLGNGIAFFASTSILIVGGLSAALASSNKVVILLRDVPFAGNLSVLAFELKVLLLIVIFIYAFIKFSWSFRLSNYCSILIGAAEIAKPDDPELAQKADMPASISGLAGMHFNRGLRSYFFALAVLPWFIHVYAFLLSTACVLIMQYRREFASKSKGYLEAYLKSQN